MKELRKESLIIDEKEIFIILYYDDEYEDYIIMIDGVEWCSTESEMHAVVLFEMMSKHILEYMTYKAL